MDIDEILEELIDRYNLNSEFSYKKNVEAENKVIPLIKQCLSQIPKSARIAIRGGGEHTEELLEILNELEYKNNIKCIIDINASQLKISDYDCIELNKIDSYCIDTVLISSYDYREQMKAELYNLNKNYKIIDIYDYLYLNNIDLKHTFYSRPIIGYFEIFYYRKKYLNEKNSKLKEIYLNKLIEINLSIRDFIYAIKYINKYIEQKYSRAEEYESFLNELNSLFDIIKDKIKQRSYKDIIINWLDALCYNNLSHMKYLNKISKESMFFENAFTFTPWTRPTMQNIMTNKKTIDEHVFDIEKINYDNSCVLKLFKEKEYVFRYIPSSWNFLFQEEFFLNDNIIQTCSTVHQWQLLRSLILINQPCVFLVHNLIEIHNSIYGGESNLKKLVNPMDTDELKEQRKLCHSYLDTQIEWYSAFLSNKCIKIYMSDHGKGACYKDIRLHVVLFVKGNGIDNLVCKKMFSHLNFFYLFKYILEPSNKNFNMIFSDFIEFQELDFYYKPLINQVFKSNKDNKTHLLCDAVSFRGVRSQYDKYILYRTGHELYFILPDENTNRINEPQYQERINELRKLTGNYFIDVYKYDKFKDSREFLETLNKKLKQNEFNFLEEVLQGDGIWDNVM